MTIILLGNCSKKRLGKSVEKNLKNVAFNIDIFKKEFSGKYCLRRETRYAIILQVRQSPKQQTHMRMMKRVPETVLQEKKHMEEFNQTEVKT